MPAKARNFGAEIADRDPTAYNVYVKGSEPR